MSDKYTRLVKLYEGWSDCSRCGLCTPIGRHRTKVAFGEGSPDASLVIIGDFPREPEDLSGSPFAGKHGEVVDEMLESCNSTRDEVFLLNITGCRSTEDDDTRRDRQPTKVEIAACAPRVHEILQIIDPFVVLLLGATALKTLTKEKSIKKLAEDKMNPQVEVLIPGVMMPTSWPAFATFHPAYLLHNWDLKKDGAVHLSWKAWQKAFSVSDVYNEQYRGIIPPQRNKDG